MTDRERAGNRISRRDLLKLGAGAGALAFVPAGVAARLVRSETPAGEAPLPQVPRRTLGKTGKSIPILLVGGAVKLDPTFDPKLAEALRFGVDYFDTAASYGNGASEAAIGSFLSRVDRSKVWITTKSEAHDPEGFERALDGSLQRLRTKSVELFFLHALQDPKRLDKDLAATVEKLKKQGKILHFGFSCHDGNVVELLRKAAETPWVEAVMFRYNFRQYGNSELNAAMDACAKANVGLIAMKTQGSEAGITDAWQKFQQTGKWTKQQAVLKAVWADPRIAAAVSHMDSFEKLKANVAAALDREELGQADFEALERYAAATRSLACDGCDHRCRGAIAAPVQIGTTMRYLMYHEAYGEPERARTLFRALPAAAQQLQDVDFAPANAACPHGVDVAWHMRRAAAVLGA
jgi:hypothetical protein